MEKYIAKTFKGLEGVLKNELVALGAQNVEEANRAVLFETDKEGLYKINLWVRTALSILKPLVSFRAFNDKTLYDKAKEVKWNEIMTIKNSFAVESMVFSKHFTHTQYVALKVKDAIADYFREDSGLRPSVNVSNPEIRVHLHIADENCTLLLDSSGEALFKRGYRNVFNKAPLNEVLAAGLIALSGWDKKSDFYDFMCGSGTIPIEAAMMALQIAPNILRRNFGFHFWHDFDEALWRKVRAEALEKQIKQEDVTFEISGSDVDNEAIDYAFANARNLQLHKFVKFFVSDFKSLKKENSPKFLIINPPYGERLQSDNIEELYAEIGTKLKHDFEGSTACIFSSNFEALKKIGLKPLFKIPLLNGALDCKLQKYELFRGKRSEKFENKNL